MELELVAQAPRDRAREAADRDLEARQHGVERAAVEGHVEHGGERPPDPNGEGAARLAAREAPALEVEVDALAVARGHALEPVHAEAEQVEPRGRQPRPPPPVVPAPREGPLGVEGSGEVAVQVAEPVEEGAGAVDRGREVHGRMVAPAHLARGVRLEIRREQARVGEFEVVGEQAGLGREGEGDRPRLGQAEADLLGGDRPLEVGAAEAREAREHGARLERDGHRAPSRTTSPSATERPST